MFGIKTWGATKGLLTKVQNLQHQATKLSVPPHQREKTNHQRLNLVNWMSIEQEVKYSTHCQTYKVLNWGIPEVLSLHMPRNDKHLQIESHIKLSTKPEWLGKNLITRSTFRNRAHFYNTLPKSLTILPTLLKFKTQLKKHMRITG